MRVYAKIFKIDLVVPVWNVSKYCSTYVFVLDDWYFKVMWSIRQVTAIFNCSEVRHLSNIGARKHCYASIHS